MADIATLEEFTLFLQTDPDTATANLLLLDLAQGLVTAQIGEQDPWPTVAKAVALAAAGRAYVNPEGLKQDTVGSTTAVFNIPADMNGVYLTPAELHALDEWAVGPGGQTRGQPQGDGFPAPYAWPDPAQHHY